jgi:hypothetical protein
MPSDWKAARTTLPPWVRTQALSRPLDSRVLEAHLDDGESEAVSLAVERRPGVPRTLRSQPPAPVPYSGAPAAGSTSLISTSWNRSGSSRFGWWAEPSNHTIFL